MRGRSALLVAVVGLLLAACTQGPASPSPDGTSGTPSNGAPWTPRQGYVANQQLPELLATVIAAPVWVASADVRDGPAGGCLTPYAPGVPCGPPAISVDLVVVGGAQQATVTVTESVERERVEARSRCVPDLRVGGIHPTAGYHCADRLEWTRSGDAWVTTQRVGNAVGECREEAVLRRGSISVMVQESLPTPWCASEGAPLDAVPLTDAQLQTLAAAAPLVTALSGWYPRESSTPSG